MANSKQAVKRIRQNERDRERNRAARSRMRTVVKNLRTAITNEDANTAQQLLAPTLKMIDSTAQKSVIHRNAAARYKSRLTKAVQALAS